MIVFYQSKSSNYDTFQNEFVNVVYFTCPQPVQDPSGRGTEERRTMATTKGAGMEVDSVVGRVVDSFASACLAQNVSPQYTTVERNSKFWFPSLAPRN